MTSVTLDNLSHGAERLFWRLILVADDYGRFNADPRVLLAKSFPLKVTTVKVSQVTAWWLELVEAGTARPYRIGNQLYGYFPKWDKHQPRQAGRRGASRFPDPPSPPAEIVNNNVHLAPALNGIVGGSPELNGIDPEYVPVVVVEDVVEDVVVSRSRSRKSETVQPGFARFWNLYPHKVGKTKALEVWATKDLEPRADEIVAGLERTMGWVMRDGGKWIPLPTTWLNGGRWADEPRHYEPMLMDKTAGNAEAVRRFSEGR